MADEEKCVPVCVAEEAIAAVATEEGAPSAASGGSCEELPANMSPLATTSRPDLDVSDSNERIPLEIAELDRKEMDAPHLDFISFLRFFEADEKRRPLADYIDRNQIEMDPHLRATIVDLLVGVAENYHLSSDTIFLTVHYFDLYLSVHAFSTPKLPLLVVSAMFIASKHADFNALMVEHFCFITDMFCTVEEVLEMEGNILKILDHEKSVPTIKTFLSGFMGAEREDEDYPSHLVEPLGLYLSELSLLEYKCLQFLPSVVAASAIYLARYTINQNIPPWSRGLRSYTRLTAPELKKCIKLIHDLQLNKEKPDLKHIRIKYRSNKYNAVSTIPPPEYIPDLFLIDLIV